MIKISMFIPVKLLKDFDTHCKKNEYTRSELIRKLIREALKGKMKTIIVKLPDARHDKFRLKKKGWQGRRYLTAAALLNRLQTVLPLGKTRRKTAVRVVDVQGHHTETLNESLPSRNAPYLLFTLACFLEDFLSKPVFNKYERAYFKGGDI